MVSQILIVMIAAIAVTIFAERRNIQAPLLLALVGLAASFIPGLERLELEPEIILTVVLPPLLFSAATEFSFVSFIRRIGSIFNLGVFLVIVTTAVVGAVAGALVPNMTLAVALVLGAVVSPPDAVTAAAVGRKLGLPASLMTVLKGESLINDAAALTLFTFAVASVSGTHLFIPNVFLYLLYSAVVGIVVGMAIAALVQRVRTRVTNATLVTVLSVLVPFTAYILAEEIGASGVLAVVAAGFSLGHNASAANFDARIQERQFWRTADGLLEAFVFAYIGLQLRFVIEDAREKGFELLPLLGVSLVVLIVALAVRIGWVFATGLLSRWRAKAVAKRLKAWPGAVNRLEEQARAERHALPERPERAGRVNRLERRIAQARQAQREGSFELMPPFSWKENLIISWTGMRGVVTLAAAAGIPLVTATGEAFPGRDVIQALAFVVTIGTLLIQGLTLPWLIRWLNVTDPNEIKRKAAQVKRADEIGRRATVAAVTSFRDTHDAPEARRMADLTLKRTDAMAAQARVTADTAGAEGREALAELADQVLAARREAIVKARDDRQLDDEVMREVLEQMDLEEAFMANAAPGRFGRG